MVITYISKKLLFIISFFCFFVFLLSKDLGWNDVSFHGSPQVPTPNIDSLASNAVQLYNYHIQPVCSPTRGNISSAQEIISAFHPYLFISRFHNAGTPDEADQSSTTFKQSIFSTSKRIIIWACPPGDILTVGILLTYKPPLTYNDCPLPPL